MKSKKPSPENIRFHAAGHLAAALLLVNAGNVEGAKTVLQSIGEYVNHTKVDAPPALKEKVAEVMASPNAADLILLEQWFVDPLNTKIEKSGGKFK